MKIAATFSIVNWLFAENSKNMDAQPDEDQFHLAPSSGEATIIWMATSPSPHLAWAEAFYI